MKRKVWHLYVLCTLLMAGNFDVSGQQAFQYAGPFQLTDYSGAAELSFRFVDGDSLFTGPFRFYTAGLDSLVSADGRYFSIRGAFKEGLPTNDWRFQFGQLTGSPELQLVDREFRSRIQGEYREMTGRMDAGRFTGEWTSSVQRLTDSKVDEQVFLSRFQFDRGIPIQSFSIENEDVSLVGRFLRDGLAHDVWELFSDAENSTVEAWVFDDGWLKEIIHYQREDTIRHRVFDVRQPAGDTVNLDERYMQVLYAKSRLHDSDQLLTESDGVHRLLSMHAEQYGQITDVLQPLSAKTSVVPAFRVRVERYPLSEEEMIAFDTLAKVYDRSEALVDRLGTNKQLKILRLSDPTLDASLDELQAIRNTWFEPLDWLLSFRDEGLVDLLPRDSLVLQLWPPAAFGRAIPKPTTWGLKGIRDVSLSVWKRLAVIQGSMDEKIMYRVRQDELEALEAQLVDKVDRLNEQIDSIADRVADPEKGALMRLRERINGPLTEPYADMTTQDERMVFMTEMVVCFEKLEALVTEVALIPARREELLALYSDRVWNPFTATLMTEILKRRIRDAYTDQLLPYLLNKVSEQSCADVEKNTLLFEKLYNRMLALREEETKKIERKLKREQNPKEILRLFGIASTLIEDTP